MLNLLSLGVSNRSRLLRVEIENESSEEKVESSEEKVESENVSKGKIEWIFV